MKKCDECGKRAEGLGTYATAFHSITLCSDCYEKIEPLRRIRNKKATSLKSFLQQKAEAIARMEELHYKAETIAEVSAWLNEQEAAIQVKEQRKEFDREVDDFLMTSGYSFEGYRIKAYHGVISGECVLGTGFLSSWDASLSDTFGVESSSFIEKLKEARESAKKRAVLACLEAGGNAMIGVDIDYTMFTSNLIGVIFNATSVTVEKDE